MNQGSFDRNSLISAMWLLYRTGNLLAKSADFNQISQIALREKCPNMELFLVRIFLYSVRIQENTDQK